MSMDDLRLMLIKEGIIQNIESAVSTGILPEGVHFVDVYEDKRDLEPEEQVLWTNIRIKYTLPDEYLNIKKQYQARKALFDIAYQYHAIQPSILSRQKHGFMVQVTTVDAQGNDFLEAILRRFDEEQGK